jgi:hypothetical protein
MNRILRRPMFRMGGTPNEGIMTGLTKPKRMGYANGSGLAGIIMGPQETDFEQIDLFDPIAEQKNKLLRIQQKSQEGKFLNEEERKLAKEAKIKSYPEIQKAKKTDQGYIPVDIANLNIGTNLEIVKPETEKPKNEPKPAPTITPDTRGSSRSDKDTIKDYMEMFKTALAGDEDSSRRQKYLELAKFGANLLAQPGGSLTSAIGKAAAPSLEGLGRIKEKEQDVETKAKLLGIQAAMDKGTIAQGVADLMKLGYTREEAIKQIVEKGTGSATREATAQRARTELTDNIITDGIPNAVAGRISGKILASGIPDYNYSLLPDKPVEGEYYYDKKGNVGQYQIRDGKPGLFEKD